MGTMLSPGWGAERPMQGGAGGLAGRLLAWVATAVRGLSRAEAREGNPLRMEARLSLGPKKQLALVDCCGRKMLLAVSGETITPLMEIAAPRRTAAGRKAPRSGNEAER